MALFLDRFIIDRCRVFNRTSAGCVISDEAPTSVSVLFLSDHTCALVAEQGMGHGSNGSRKSDGSHGSWVTRC